MYPSKLLLMPCTWTATCGTLCSRPSGSSANNTLMGILSYSSTEVREMMEVQLRNPSWTYSQKTKLLWYFNKTYKSSLYECPRFPTDGSILSHIYYDSVTIRYVWCLGVRSGCNTPECKNRPIGYLFPSSQWKKNKQEWCASYKEEIKNHRTPLWKLLHNLNLTILTQNRKRKKHRFPSHQQTNQVPQ